MNGAEVEIWKNTNSDVNGVIFDLLFTDALYCAKWSKLWFDFHRPASSCVPPGLRCSEASKTSPAACELSTPSSQIMSD